MNKIARRLGPATRSTAVFHVRPHHVNTFQYRAAFRCIHSGSNGQAGNEASGPKSEGRTDGSDGEGPSESKPQQSDEPLEQGMSAAVEEAGPSISSQPGQHTDSDAKKEKPVVLISGIRRVSSLRHDGVKSVPKLTKREAAMKLEKSRITKKKINPPYHIMKRSCTFECEFPEQATKENLLIALKGIKFTAKQWDVWAKQAGRQAVVLVFTPSFAALVENDASFIPDVLEALIRKPPWKKEEPLEIDVVCACVDGLSPGPEMLPISVGHRPKEGFSILHGPECNTLHPLWNDNEILPSTSPSMQSSITLRKGLSGPPDLTLPLANTLFKTGRLSTLLVSRWEYNPSENGFFAIKGPAERTNAIINLFEDMKLRLPKSFIPAVALTPARPIVNGLGNIVRTIDFGGEEGIGPASRELESTVMKYLDVMGYGNTTIDVWALVIPPDLGPKKAKLGASRLMPHRKSLTTPADEVEGKWMAPEDLSQESSYVGSWIPKGNAKFCRVLSGGGGWGAKQGLLSLDPQTTYSEIAEARFDFSGGSLEDQQTSALGNIAQEGSYIQFFVARRVSKEYPTYDGSVYKVLMRRSAVFGAVPSTVDDIPTPPPEVNKDSTDATPPFIIRRGHFGFVSESGMFVRHGPDPKPDQPPTPDSFTKVDLPYSYFYVDYKTKTKSKEPGKKKPLIRQVHAAKRDLLRRVVL